MKEKRNQEDDRQWKADQPNKSAFYRSHLNLPPRKQLSVAVLVPDGVVCSCRCRFLAAHVRLQLRRVVGEQQRHPSYVREITRCASSRLPIIHLDQY